jgi:hypothetical protein
MGNCAAKRRAAEKQALLEREATGLSGLTGSASNRINDVDGSSSDLYGAPSGYGDGGYVYATYCPEGIPEDIALLATAAALAAGIYVIYRQITIQTKGKKRRKRSGGKTPVEDVSKSDGVVNWLTGHNYEEPDGSSLGFIESSPLWTVFVAGTSL